MASKMTVLLTGATGYVGFPILERALQEGWHVRAAVRSEEKAESIRSHPAIKALTQSSPSLTFTIVKDITSPGAYDEAVKGVDYVIHVASPTPDITNFADPISDEDSEKDFRRPAVQGTITMLESAKKETSIRRVIITSSIVAVMPPAVYCGMEQPAPGTVFSAQHRMELPPLPYPIRLYAYCASKIAALNASDAWLAKEKPAFSVVNVHPGLVQGRSNQFQTPQEVMTGTNAAALSVALGARREQVMLCGSTVHLDDVTKVHIESLDETKVKVDGSRSFVVTSSASYEAIPALVTNEFQQYVDKGILRNDGLQPTNKVEFDVKDTEEIFQFRHQQFLDQMRSSIGQYVELASKA